MAAPRATVVRKVDVATVDVVSCHSVTADGGWLALCPNTEEIHIFRLEGNEFRMVQTLSKHTQRVTGLAWSPPDEGYCRLVSCAEDRTAFVWERDPQTDTWCPYTVELSASRAALCVEWAPNGTRFAVGLASKDTAICYWNDVVESWIAKKVGSSKASVVAVAWHPGTEFIATGSTDCRVQVYNVSEENMLPDPRPPFGQLQLEEDTGSWVNAVMFSTSGRYLAFLTQDSTVGIKDLSQGPQAEVVRVRWKGLPFSAGCFLNDGSLVACGFDFVPVLFQKGAKTWECRNSIDVRTQSAPSPKAAVAASAVSEGRARFGTIKGEAQSTTSHTSVITACHLLSATDELPRFSTSGQDGQVLIWQVDAL